VQRQSVSRTGGYAIYAGLLVAVVVSLFLLPRFPEEPPKILGFVLGALILLPLAIVDDFRRLGPLPQFVGQLLASGVAVWLGIRLDSFANPAGGLIAIPLIVAVPLTIVWFVGMINTLNFVDTMDGLAGGISAIAAIVLCVRAVGLGQYSIAALMMALAGAALGFLPRNLNPARIFMGSSGSMLLGYSLAALAILGGAKVATIAMVMGIPILDTALVIVHRLLRGRSPFQGGDGAHLPHRLLAAGVPQRWIAYLLYALCLLFGYLALALTAMQKLYALVIMVVVLGGGVFVSAWRSRARRVAEPRPPG
jgi:UDP-GlcNAc:undecaprenyl-phosphate GlcNAc-1-phosphate transferase